MSAAITPARRAAFSVLRRTFEDGAFADRAFASAATRLGLAGRDLAHARRLAYGAVQRRGTTDQVAARLARRPLARLDPAVVAALRLGLYELLWSDAGAPHAAVDQAVELAKAGLRADRAPAGKAAGGASLVNAVLRRAAADREAIVAGLDARTAGGAALAYSYPGWLAELWWEQLGPADARAVMAAMNDPAETAVRVNTLRASPERVAAALRAEGIEVEGPGIAAPVSLPEALVVDRAGPPVGARIATGELQPQSRGSQAAVALLDPHPGERVLDLCAGPGIKTAQIAARLGNRGEVTAFERDPRRAEQIDELCARAGASCVRVVVGDVAEAELGSGYDRVLVDPPCSDLGTLASRPDARWRKSPDLIERLAALQRRIAVRGARALRPGGTLVYSTCTISARENEAVAAALPGQVDSLSPDDLGALAPRTASERDRRFLQLRPDRDRTTGFFLARFRRGRPAQPGSGAGR